MTDGEWTISTLKHLVETQLAQRDKHWNEIRASYEHRLSVLQAKLDALESRYEERHEKVEIDISLIKARLYPVFWLGAIITVTVIGLVISHIAAGAP